MDFTKMKLFSDPETPTKERPSVGPDMERSLWSDRIQPFSTQRERSPVILSKSTKEAEVCPDELRHCIEYPCQKERSSASVAKT
jgi:hypothetical protein